MPASMAGSMLTISAMPLIKRITAWPWRSPGAALPTEDEGVARRADPTVCQAAVALRRFAGRPRCWRLYSWIASPAHRTGKEGIHPTPQADGWVFRQALFGPGRARNASASRKLASVANDSQALQFAQNHAGGPPRAPVGADRPHRAGRREGVPRRSSAWA